MECWRGLRQRNRAHNERDVPEAVPKKDDNPRAGFDRDEDRCELPKRHKDDGFSQRRPSVDLSATKRPRRGAKIAAQVPRLQPLVSPGRTRHVERGTLCQDARKIRRPKQNIGYNK